MDNIKKFKKIILEYKYKYLLDIIIKINKHIDYLYVNNYINIINKNTILNKLALLLYNINKSYNNFIINIDIKDQLYYLLLDVEDININDIKTLFNDKTVLPLHNEENLIKEFILNVGYINLEELFKILEITLSYVQKQLIDEINEIFIPIKISYYENIYDSYIWYIPNIYDDNDILELKRQLYINNIIIDGYFINDSLVSYYKTSHICYPLYNINITNIINKMKNTNEYDTNFIYNFIKYDYIGNIYCYTLENYIKYIDRIYMRYTEIINSNLSTIINKINFDEFNVKIFYEHIFLLLIGNNNTIDIANVLLNILKHKYNKKHLIYNIINNRLPNALLLKIEKSKNRIDKEMFKFKYLKLNSLDYEKQLIINKNIPDNIKALTFEKIQEMKMNNNDYYKQLIYVKTILNFPWTNDESLFKEINLDISRAPNYLLDIQSKLDNFTYGHDEAKQSILQIISKWITNPDTIGTCIGLMGPPGVGKTLFAKSIGHVLNIPFSEITLGGQNDGELLHGHGYTYSGSQPGLIIKKMADMGKANCILYFDELDKVSVKYNNYNEISNILIHLTDSNMNKKFQDRFFQGIDFPLDKVIMIFSYNDSSVIDPILLDRLKQIIIHPYTLLDKIQIVKQFIIPEISEMIQLDINITDDLIKYIIENYTNEAGVRTIKRHIEQIYLTLNLEKFIPKLNYSNTIDKDIINKILTKPNIYNTVINDKPLIGIINGLYATPIGNCGIIPIQIFNNFSYNSQQNYIKITGNQGDIMKESIHCSLTVAIEYLKKNEDKYIQNIDNYLLSNFKNGFHVHIPYTSIPKNGPSAGCAFVIAFISRILNLPIKNDIAITGEISLIGKSYKIGNLNYKLIGAKKSNIKNVYVPKDNYNDYEAIIEKDPTLIDDNFNIYFFENIDEIIDSVLIK